MFIGLISVGREKCESDKIGVEQERRCTLGGRDPGCAGARRKRATAAARVGVAAISRISRPLL